MPGSRSIEPKLVSVNLFQRLGLLLFIAFATFLLACTLAYALGYLPQAGSNLKTLRLGQGSRLAAFSPLVSGIVGLAAFLVLVGVFRAIEFLLKKAKHPSPLVGRQEKTLEQFVAEATGQTQLTFDDAQAGEAQATTRVSARVAREGHSLLERSYPRPVCIELQDDLRSSLGLTEDEIVTLRLNLLRHTDRREDSDATVAEIHTVGQLLQNVENAPLQYLNTSVASLKVVADRSGTRTRATDAEQIAGTHATSSRGTGESRIAGPSGSQITASALRRRSGDYSGPRRRATDKLPQPVYRGPFRRLNDPVSGSRPRATTSGERRIEQTSAELSKLDPLFMPRRNRPKPPEGT